MSERNRKFLRDIKNFSYVIFSRKRTAAILGYGGDVIGLNLDNYRFGVEVEFSNISRKQAAQALAHTLNGIAVEQGGAYRKWIVKDPQGRIWQVMYDSSVIATNGGEQCEFVTPVLTYSADMSILQECLRNLYRVGARVNERCGTHVHVSRAAGQFDADTLVRLCKIIYSKQDLLYKALGVEDNSRRIDYCKKVNNDFVRRLENKKPKSLQAFAEEYYLGYGGAAANANQHYSSSRYTAVNLHNLLSNSSKKTIEFRLFNSTLHAGWARTYVILSIAIVNQAVCQRSARAKITETDNPAFTLRTWLLRMGFIGDVFKNPRQHLLNRFSAEGYSKAWRYR